MTGGPRGGDFRSAETNGSADGADESLCSAVSMVRQEWSFVWLEGAGRKADMFRAARRSLPTFSAILQLSELHVFLVVDGARRRMLTYSSYLYCSIVISQLRGSYLCLGR